MADPPSATVKSVTRTLDIIEYRHAFTPATISGDVVGAFSVAIPVVRFDADVERRASDLLARTADLLTAAR